jgi:hypothetical protein
MARAATLTQNGARALIPAARPRCQFVAVSPLLLGKFGESCLELALRLHENGSRSGYLVLRAQFEGSGSAAAIWLHSPARPPPTANTAYVLAVVVRKRLQLCCDLREFALQASRGRRRERWSSGDAPRPRAGGLLKGEPAPSLRTHAARLRRAGLTLVLAEEEDL